jgi:uncharacterized membrane protein
MIEDYFAQLESKMSDLPKGDRQEFTRELRAHVLDRLEQTAVASEADCRSVLKALGSPEEIARQYRLERIMSRSAWRISPLSVLRTLLRWTITGVQGYAVFVVAVMGYSFAAAFYVTALLKPFFPHNVGMFVSEQGINLTRFPIQPSGVEVMGPYYIPFAVLLGYLFTVATTLVIRFVVRRLRNLRQRIRD